MKSILHQLLQVCTNGKLGRVSLLCREVTCPYAIDMPAIVAAFDGSHWRQEASATALACMHVCP